MTDKNAEIVREFDAGIRRMHNKAVDACVAIVALGLGLDIDHKTLLEQLENLKIPEGVQ